MFWDGQQGSVIFAGLHYSLHCAPRVCGRQVAQIDYSPSVGLRAVLDAGPAGAWRELTEAERDAIDATLMQLINKVHELVC